MKHLFRLLLVAGVILLAWWAWTVFFPSPQAAIQRRLNNLAKAASFSAGEGNIASLMNVEKLCGFFSDQVDVKVDVPGYQAEELVGRDELKQAAMAAHGLIHGLKASFPDMRIEVASGNQEAIVDLTLDADVGGDKSAIVQEMKFNLKKVAGVWVITHVETVKTLK